MRRIAMWSAAAVLPAVLVSALVGCSSTPTTGGGAPSSTNPSTGGGSGGKPTAIVAKETGTLKGKVSFKGDKAALKLDEETAKLRKQMEDKDAQHCIKDVSVENKAQTEQQVWRIADDGGLANVIVYLRPPTGKFFSIDLDKVKNFEKDKSIDQPHCAFVPHVQVLFPEYKAADGTKKETKQTFVIKNSSGINHNTRIEGKQEPAGFDKSIESKGKMSIDTIKTGYSPLTFKCAIHPFMTAYGLALDHPYAAVTNEKGEFEIADVPADVEVLVAVWHEDGVSKDYEKGKEVKLKPGKNEMDFTVEKK